MGKVLRIAFYFVYRRKSFAMLILHANFLLYKHVEANRRKSFAIATAIAKLFPCVTFLAYGISALKPGRVIRVTFSPGHLGLTQFTNYQGLTRIGSREKQN